MRNSAIIFTSAALALGLLSVVFPSEAASPVAGPAASCINWVPTSAVQLAAASLGADEAAPDTVVVPHPDKEKCPCKGTGVIIHGDGHKTECPYHGKDVPDTPDDSGQRCQCDRPGYYCACDEEYGKCQCPPLTVSKINQSSGG